MANRTDRQIEFGSEMQWLAGVWALVVVAVLATAAFV